MQKKLSGRELGAHIDNVPKTFRKKRYAREVTDEKLDKRAERIVLRIEKKGSCGEHLHIGCKNPTSRTFIRTHAGKLEAGKAVKKEMAMKVWVSKSEE